MVWYTDIATNRLVNNITVRISQKQSASISRSEIAIAEIAESWHDEFTFIEVAINGSRK